MSVLKEYGAFNRDGKSKNSFLTKKAFGLNLPIEHISITYLYNFDPLKPHFYIVKLGFTGAYIIFLISAQKHKLWVFVRTASMRGF